MKDIITLLSPGTVILFAIIGIRYISRKLENAVSKEELVEHCANQHALINLQYKILTEKVDAIFERINSINEYLRGSYK